MRKGLKVSHILIINIMIMCINISNFFSEKNLHYESRVAYWDTLDDSLAF